MLPQPRRDDWRTQGLFEFRDAPEFHALIEPNERLLSVKTVPMQTRSHRLRQVSSAQVAARCALRVAAIGMVAMFSSEGFGKSLVALFAVCAILCVVLALVRRERAFGPTLTHWEEGTAYVMLCLIALIAF
jgi:hypothetical protein